MTGYHMVRRFSIRLNDDQDSDVLPEGWKPFAAHHSGGNLHYVYARKWVRVGG